MAIWSVRGIGFDTDSALYQRFIVRDFKWNESQIQQDKKELAEITGTEKELWVGVLIRFGHSI
jgi:hypothetical protein